MVRKSVCDGSFYLANPSSLSSTIEQYLNNVDIEIKEEILGIVSPHAGYIYSGQTAAFGYENLRNSNKKLIILLGPSHHLYVNGFSVFGEGKWETPLGEISIDDQFASKLITHSELIKNEPETHSREHSLEVQLPFLQKVLKDFKIVPIIFNTDNLSELSVLSEALYSELKNKKNWVIIISSDLYHGYDYNKAKKITDNVDKYIKKLDSKGLLEYDRRMRENGICAACGSSAIAVLLQVMEKLNQTDVKLLKRTTSGDVTGDKNGYVVGYGTWAFTKNTLKKNTNKDTESYLSFNLTSEEKEKLLNIARETINQYIRNGKTLDITVQSETLKKKCGAFVTLREKRGNLRGCIGLIVAEKPIFITIRDMAIAAATQDPRFNPVSSSEIDNLEIEISVLTPMQKVGSIDEIKVGRDGLMIRKGYMSGLLLPQVPSEQGWDKNTFLEHTCYKAGLPANAWKSADIWKFQAIVFSEGE
jgi:MEMO1 family protein